MAGLLSLSSALHSGLGERRAECAILELDDLDQPLGDYLAFQYFPETITDQKAVNYQTKEIPGGSLPLYQFVAGGERVISFRAVFTADVDILKDPQSFQKLVTKGGIRRNVDIRTAVLWLRRFMMPRYGATQQLGVPLTQAPHKLILRVANSGIGLNGGLVSFQTAAPGTNVTVDAAAGSSGVLTDSTIAIMTQCEVEYGAFFPSGLPRLVVVQLAFAQIAQIGGTVNFPAATPVLDNYVTGNGEKDTPPIYRYPLKVTFT